MGVKFASLAIAIFGLAGTAGAQAAPAPAQPPVAIPNPHYVSIVQEIEINRPAAAVWARVGKYCGISEWFGMTCALVSGQDGDLGAVRVLNGSIIEMLVAKTDLSYTYAQPVRVGVPYNAYHGTMEAKPVSATSSKMVYSLFFDNSMLPDDAAREQDIARRKARFAQALQNMKILAEGGTLPASAPAAR